MLHSFKVMMNQQEQFLFKRSLQFLSGFRWENHLLGYNTESSGKRDIHVYTYV